MKWGFFFVLMPPEMDVSIGLAGVKIYVPFPSVSALLSQELPRAFHLKLFPCYGTWGLRGFTAKYARVLLCHFTLHGVESLLRS